MLVLAFLPPVLTCNGWDWKTVPIEMITCIANSSTLSSKLEIYINVYISMYSKFVTIYSGTGSSSFGTSYRRGKHIYGKATGPVVYWIAPGIPFSSYYPRPT